VELAKRAEVILLLAAVRPYQENQEVYQRLAYTSTTKIQLLPLLRPEVSLGVRRFLLFCIPNGSSESKIIVRSSSSSHCVILQRVPTRQKQASGTTLSVTKMVTALGQFPDGRPDPGYPSILSEQSVLDFIARSWLRKRTKTDC
jgi:hypothetical protein